MGKYSSKRQGFTLLEVTFAGVLAGALLAGVFKWHVKFSYFYQLQHREINRLNSRLFAHYYLWHQLVKAGWAGRMTMRQLNITLPGKVWRCGVYAISREQLPLALATRKASSDVLEVAYALEDYCQLPKDFDPKKQKELYFKVPASFKRFTHALIEDGVSSEVAILTPQGLRISDCLHPHAKATTRVYPLGKMQFFVAQLANQPKALYRIFNYESQAKLFNLEDLAISGSFATSDANDSDVTYYPLEYLTENNCWDQVKVIKLTLTFAGSERPLEIFAKLYNAHDGSF